MPTNQTVKLTLFSHQGKGLVLKDKVDRYEGHDVNWFTIGDSYNALEVTFQYTDAGHCFIKYNRHGGKEGHSLDCAMGKYHEGN